MVKTFGYHTDSYFLELLAFPLLSISLPPCACNMWGIVGVSVCYKHNSIILVLYATLFPSRGIETRKKKNLLSTFILAGWSLKVYFNWFTCVYMCHHA